ncbi:hypothetical protein OEZ86_007193 [Tetradesmus obliquus]|nr:hypothetical protein OEZ86_007193 [Tetradesmus obliquus]
MGQLQSCLSGQQAVDADVGKDAQQRSKLPAKAALPTVASAPANPAASAQKSVSAITSSAAQQQPEQAAGKTAAGDAAGGLAGATPLAGNTTAAAAAAAAAGQTGQTGQSKKLDFDPHQTQPGQLGAPVLPGAPHNPHLNGPPRPPCEDERLEVAEQISELLDAAPKKELENILSLVCSIFGVGNALIALFGDRRIYILNTIGGFKAGDFPWRWSFCGWTMASEQHSVMVINDALEDARFHDNKYVQELGVRFYCGAPLVSSSGHRLGTLCFADSQPRVFDTSSLQILVNFAELVTRELEKDISLAKQQLAQASSSKAEHAAQYKLMLRTLDCVTSAVLLVDTSKPDWTIIVEQVRGRQSFTLRGVKLSAGFGGASAQLSFRCAGFSTLEGAIAAGSYGRVYRGDYFGSKVAVKVLDGHAVLRRDETTGFCLEALLSEQLKHPNIVRTLAWAVVTGKGKLPARQQVWGETLDPDKPSVDTIAAAVAGANCRGSNGAAAAGANGAAKPRGNNPYDNLMQLGTPGTPAATAAPGVTNCVSNGVAAGGYADGMDDDEGPRDEDVTAGQTWMVLEYCDKGCLQDAVERGWLRQSRSCVSGPVNLLAVLATAAEVAGGMALLHSNGIIHGDLSAFNVMLSSADPAAAIGQRGFVAKVADFGLSRMLTHGSKVVTKTYGTITHMPPETLEHGVAGKSADVYSFGVLLWQMVTGSRAWAGMSHMAVVNAVCCDKKTLQFPADAPDALVMLGKACMAYNPAERPTFQDILDILEPLNEWPFAHAGEL